MKGDSNGWMTRGSVFDNSLNSLEGGGVEDMRPFIYLLPVPTHVRALSGPLALGSPSPCAVEPLCSERD